MEVTFGANQTPVAAPAAPAAAPDQTTPGGFENGSTVPELVKKGAIARSNMLLGDYLPPLTEIILPRVNITQNIGNLKDIFEPGVLVYNRDTVLFEPAIINPRTNTLEKEPTPPVTITFCGLRPAQFVEKTKGGARGLVCRTEEAVIAAGGTLDYQEWKLKEAAGIKYFQPMLDILVAIERPAAYANRDPEPTFCFPVGDRKYVLAMWALRGTAYTALFKKVLGVARQMGCLRQEGYPSWSFSVSTREESYPGTTNRAWIPIAVPREKNSAEFVNWVRGILDPNATVTTDSAANS